LGIELRALIQTSSPTHFLNLLIDSLVDDVSLFLTSTGGGGRYNQSLAGVFGNLPRGKWFPRLISSLFENLYTHIDSRAASDSVQDFDHQRTFGLLSGLDIEKTSENSTKLIKGKGFILYHAGHLEQSWKYTLIPLSVT
jgi:hypothetical protein